MKRKKPTTKSHKKQRKVVEPINRTSATASSAPHQHTTTKATTITATVTREPILPTLTPPRRSSRLRMGNSNNTQSKAEPPRKRTRKQTAPDEGETKPAAKAGSQNDNKDKDSNKQKQKTKKEGSNNDSGKKKRGSKESKMEQAKDDNTSVPKEEETKKEETPTAEDHDGDGGDGDGGGGSDDEDDTGTSDIDEVQSREGITPEEYTKEATERLMQELKELSKPEIAQHGFSVEPVNDNIYKWHVKLFGWDNDTQIKQDLILFESVTGKDHVLMEIIFPKDYPHVPFFLRMVYPRFHQYTGHITIGGSVCIKELTKSGWSKEFQLLTFLVFVRNLLLEGGALIDMDNAETEYSEHEAKEAFTRVARQHGWQP
eukprot:TRINITY_DN1240_c0_g1_i1.p1 TRINITY_DN1240_c0_g1~~TRINITY_DN1240_c0_g1_i1.p1  ORF type:complete len:372 (-),score=110.32 TRINITY_DN1240_c0_g1_i1:52-1167(-)